MSQIPAGLSDSETMAARWNEYARVVAQARATAEVLNGHGAGELVVMGTGLGNSDLLPDLALAVAKADYVFYCLADAVTQILVRRMRPDAYDLSILYNANFPRYDTYMQMAEAMLYPVRAGKKVIALYYGHPGIFAMPTHRAMKIARKEGFSAHMRPGISALDYLIADIGFDPAYPGLISYEASDMLLRQRNLDPTLHVVLWQVGLIGEFGYSKNGFRNDGFDLLVEYIERVYGPDWLVTHYIASRFPGVEPIIDLFPVSELRLAHVRSKLKALSTFYIAPMRARGNDRDTSIKMGLIKEDDPTPSAVLEYDVTQYGRNESAAIERLGAFQAPIDYRCPADTPGVDAVLEISRDLKLQSDYRRDPSSAISEDRFPKLTDAARHNLVSRKIWSVQRAVADGGKP